MNAGRLRGDLAAAKALAVATVNESSVVSAGTECWHYFSSAEYSSAAGSFPANDSVPRVWVITAY